MDQINAVSEDVMPYLIDYGLEVIGTIFILIIGLAAAKWLGRWVEGYLKRSERMDNTLIPLFVKTVKSLVIVVTIIAVLDQFGVGIASLIAVLGAIGLAIGLALQGTLSNIASGVMLLLLRPFNVGDAVEIAGTAGVVDEIGLFITDMHTFDNIAVTMPNSEIWGNEIKNYTRNPTRRVDFEFGIDYEDDMDKAIRVVQEVLQADERVLDEPEPLVAVNNLGDNAVGILARPWTDTENVWPLRFDITKRLKERFDEEEISFPFPQRDVHLFEENGE